MNHDNGASTSSVSPLVTLNSVSKRYRLRQAKRIAKSAHNKLPSEQENLGNKENFFYAVNNISTFVNVNDRIAIVGPNGCGKSTLINLIAQTKQLSSGKIDYNFSTSADREKIGIQFQENVYPTNSTVSEVVNFYRTIYYKSISREAFEEFLSVFELKPLLKRRINSLSGGQKQRLNVLIAILHKPQLIILDEISTGLDIAAQETISSFINQIVKKYNLTLLLVSHNVYEINILCNRLWLINEGKLIDDLFISDIIKNNKSLNDYLSSRLGKLK